MWMTRRPAASRRAAAATTSMTMNAGTSLREDADTSRFAFPRRLALSSMMAVSGMMAMVWRGAIAPLSPHFPDWYRHVRRPVLTLTSASLAWQHRSEQGRFFDDGEYFLPYGHRPAFPRKRGRDVQEVPGAAQRGGPD